MDTKLRKTYKLKNVLIALSIVIPAILLTSLYPSMEKAMVERKAQWMAEWEKQKQLYEKEQAETLQTDTEEKQENRYYLQDYYINYAMETSYYQYALLLQQASGEESYIRILDEFGWINDYFKFMEKTPYYAQYSFVDEQEEENIITSVKPPLHLSEEIMETYLSGKEPEESVKEQMVQEGYLGYLYLNYDSYGKLTEILLKTEDGVEYDADLYERAKASVDQYKHNVENYDGEVEIDTKKAFMVQPKNFQAVYLLYDDHGFFMIKEADNQGDVYYEDAFSREPRYMPPEIYIATGAYFIAAFMAIFVLAAALILPLFKKLDTGWEKLFSLPAEIVFCIAIAAGTLFIAMCVLMSYTTIAEITTFMVEQGNSIELLGYRFTVQQCYYILLGMNVLGWMLVFSLEYICVAHIRQLFCRPKYYVEHRFLTVKIFRYLGRKLQKLVEYIFHVDMNKKLHSAIIKLVAANGIILVLLCCFWFVGIPLALIYSVILYLLLKKYGGKYEKQYENISQAAHKMAQGDLNFTKEDDLGIFSDLGKELEEVREGIVKAVDEKVKSQHMKTELITNVSHDLKTPLTAIITYIDLLKQEGVTEEERRSYINTLDIKSQRLKGLIEDLFEVSKANSGNIQINLMEVDLVQLLKEVRVEMADKLEASKLDFRWNLPEKKINLNLDGQRTYRIFENLLNNAIKYSMPFSRVYVDMKEMEASVMIIFKNMSAAELNIEANDLTERFVRGDSARNSEGSGLGLAIAKSFTQLQKGSFDISVDGDLFKVSVTFPIERRDHGNH